MGQYRFARCRLSSVGVVCNAAGRRARERTAAAGPAPSAWAVGRPTLHGGPVRLRSVRAAPRFIGLLCEVAWWLAIKRLGVRYSVWARLCNDYGQVVHISVPLSPSSITYYQSKAGVALRLGREP